MLNHGTNLREEKEKGESKEMGRWKGKMTKYGVARASTKQLYTFKMTHKTNSVYLELHTYTSR
jgi:hypothetical protein